MRAIAVLVLWLFTALPTFAQTPDDGAKVRAVIADWYSRVGHAEADRPYLLMAPGGVDAGPGYAEIPDIPAAQRSAAAWSGPHINNELAAQALKFSYDIDVLKVDAHLAKAMVWERGYFYAYAAQQTYENAALAMFVLEKQADGRWLILAHQATSIGIPPTKVTTPMPDLHDLFYATVGKDRDPVTDAKAAKAN
ncbi:MAG TPA: hypothetical protein VG942_09520 [Hyphomonadaceae bacterium]|nr:hypothetical protein [Hyphomonadaceae bacterium]